jgi:hypothetical protein
MPRLESGFYRHARHDEGSLRPLASGKAGWYEHPFIARSDNYHKQGSGRACFLSKILVDYLCSFDRVAPLVERKNSVGEQPGNGSNRFCYV